MHCTVQWFVSVSSTPIPGSYRSSCSWLWCPCGVAEAPGAVTAQGLAHRRVLPHPPLAPCTGPPAAPPPGRSSTQLGAGTAGATTTTLGTAWWSCPPCVASSSRAWAQLLTGCGAQPLGVVGIGDHKLRLTSRTIVVVQPRPLRGRAGRSCPASPVSPGVPPIPGVEVRGCHCSDDFERLVYIGSISSS